MRTGLALGGRDPAGLWQPSDAELAEIAALAPSEGDFLRYVSGAWVLRSAAQMAALSDFTDKFAATKNGGLEAFYDAGNSGTAQTIDLANGNWQKSTLTGNCTYTFTGATSGKACSLLLSVVQDGTGSRAVTWPASVKWPGGTIPTLGTAASAFNLVSFVTRDGGTTWYGALVGASFA
jgi:hypothetical protein